MAAVGAYLRELRQRRGLSLEEMSRATRVAPRYLEALETDQFSALPATVFTRGFIRAYCHVLGESPDEALARYDARAGVTSPPARPAPVAAPTATTSDGESRSRGAIIISAVLVVVLGVALFAVALVTQPGREERVDRRAPGAEQASAPTAPTASRSNAPAPPAASSEPPRAAAPGAATVAPGTSASPRPAPTPSAPNTAAPVPAPPSPAGSAVAKDTPPAAPSPAWLPNVQAATGGMASPYRLVARVSEPTWIRVRTEDGHNTEETIPAGQTREWVSNRPFVLTLGNAGGVALELNGRPLPPLGPSGAVISRIVLPPQ